MGDRNAHHRPSSPVSPMIQTRLLRASVKGATVAWVLVWVACR